MIRFGLLFVLLFVLRLNSALAWGPIGHRVVGEIAQKRLKPEVAKIVSDILDKQTLADVSNWADLIRSDPQWRKADPWHYVNIEDGKKYNDQPPAAGGDVIKAVEEFTQVLKNKKSTAQAKKEALSFLVHFIGDLHQPLHVGRRSDKGGNGITLKWFGRKSNLHQIWDEKMIELEQLSFTEYAAFIDKGHADEAQWAKDSLMTWISESQALRSQVYDLPRKLTPYWEYEYRYKNVSMMNERLLKAGVRLAAQLNQIFL